MRFVIFSWRSWVWFYSDKDKRKKDDLYSLDLSLIDGTE